MRALFIGGTGTISMAIVRRLAEKTDWEVWLLNRGNRAAEVPQAASGSGPGIPSVEYFLLGFFYLCERIQYLHDVLRKPRDDRYFSLLAVLLLLYSADRWLFQQVLRRAVGQGQKTDRDKKGQEEGSFLPKLKIEGVSPEFEKEPLKLKKRRILLR